jgi:hypothetical protein
MKTRVPPFIYDLKPGVLTAVIQDPNVVLYLREDEFGLRKYPPQCPVELEIGTWNVGDVVLVVLLLRLAHRDATTFEAWVNVGDPEGVRMLQTLKPQDKVDVHIVTDRLARSFRVPNPLRLSASALVHVLRQHNAWSPEEFVAAQRRLTQLFPTPRDLWWRCQQADS